MLKCSGDLLPRKCGCRIEVIFVEGGKLKDCERGSFMIRRMNVKEIAQKVHAILQEKHRWLKIVVLLELILAAFFIILYFQRINNLVSYHFDTDQIASYTSEEYEGCFGGTIDESYSAGMYDAIPHMFLKKGYYRYSM